MALTPTDYTLLFTHIGEFVQRTNDFTTLYTDLDSDFTEINDALYSAVAADDRADITSGLPESFDSFKSSVEGWISIMTSKSTDLLTRLNSVLEKLPLAGATDVQSVLTEIIRDMNASVPPQTVEDSAITVGAIGISVPTTNARETGTAHFPARASPLVAPARQAIPLMSARYVRPGVVSSLPGGRGACSAARSCGDGRRGTAAAIRGRG